MSPNSKSLNKEEKEDLIILLKTLVSSAPFIKQSTSRAPTKLVRVKKVRFYIEDGEVSFNTISLGDNFSWNIFSLLQKIPNVIIDDNVYYFRVNKYLTHLPIYISLGGKNVFKESIHSHVIINKHGIFKQAIEKAIEMLDYDQIN